MNEQMNETVNEWLVRWKDRQTGGSIEISR